jgi:hypothetical protein
VPSDPKTDHRLADVPAFWEDKMSESEFVRDLVQEGIRQAMQLEALKNIQLLINTAWFAIISTPVVLTLILWRVW